jgi:small subunit ribosomal protein S16
LVVKLRLKRFGRLNHPTYRVSVIDGHKRRDGRVIETLGYYLPKVKKSDDQVKLDTERAEYWLSVGAQPSETVASLIKRCGGTLPTPKKRVRKKSKATARPFVPPRKKRKARPKAAAK